jgi:hypothetical protein
MPQWHEGTLAADPQTLAIAATRAWNRAFLYVRSMSRPYRPRVLYYLMAAALALFAATVLLAATGQPIAMWNLTLGLGLGINIGAFSMLGEVRKPKSYT